MLDMRMNLIYTDGRKVEVKIRPADIVAFEMKFDVAVTEAFSMTAKTKLSHIYYLAFSAADTTLTFEEWLKSLEEIEMGEVGGAAPLALVPPAGS